MADSHSDATSDVIADAEPFVDDTPEQNECRDYAACDQIDENTEVKLLVDELNLRTVPDVQSTVNEAGSQLDDNTVVKTFLAEYADCQVPNVSDRVRHADQRGREKADDLPLNTQGPSLSPVLWKQSESTSGPPSLTIGKADNVTVCDQQQVNNIRHQTVYNNNYYSNSSSNNNTPPHTYGNDLQTDAEVIHPEWQEAWLTHRDTAVFWQAVGALRRYGRVLLYGPPGTHKAGMGLALLHYFQAEGYRPHRPPSINCQTLAAVGGASGRSVVLLEEGLGEVALNTEQLQRCKELCFGAYGGAGPGYGYDPQLGSHVGNGQSPRGTGGREGQNLHSSHTSSGQNSHSSHTSSGQNPHGSRTSCCQVSHPCLLVITAYPHIWKELEKFESVSHSPLLDQSMVVSLRSASLHPTKADPLPATSTWMPLLQRLVHDPEKGTIMAALLALKMMPGGKVDTDILNRQPPEVVGELQRLGFSNVSCCDLEKAASHFRGSVLPESGPGFSGRHLYDAAGLVLGRGPYLPVLLKVCDAAFLVKHVRAGDTEGESPDMIYLTGPENQTLLMLRMHELALEGQLQDLCLHPCLGNPAFLDRLYRLCKARRGFLRQLARAKDAIHGLPLLYWSAWSGSIDLTLWCLRLAKDHAQGEKGFTRSVLSTALAVVVLQDSTGSPHSKARAILGQLLALNFKASSPDTYLELTLPLRTEAVAKGGPVEGDCRPKSTAMTDISRSEITPTTDNSRSEVTAMADNSRSGVTSTTGKNRSASTAISDNSRSDIILGPLTGSHNSEVIAEPMTEINSSEVTPEPVKDNTSAAVPPSAYCYLNKPSLPIPSSLLSITFTQDSAKVVLPAKHWYLVLRLLCDRRVDEADRDGNTLLHTAVESGDQEAIRLVLKSGASVAAQNKKGLTPCRLAETRCKPRLFRSADSSRPAPGTLHAACEGGDVEQVKILLCAGCGPRDKHGVNKDTPLHAASRSGHAHIARLLLDLRVEVNAENKDDATPLHCASHEGRLDVVRLLVSRGADLSLKASYRTALHLASRRGHFKVVAFLLEHCGDVNVRGFIGYTALHEACIQDRQDVARLLLQQQAAVNCRDGWGHTPLHHACKANNVQLVQLLLEHGADVNVANEKGLSAVDLAQSDGHSALVDILLGAHRHHPLVRVQLEAGRY